MARPNDPTQNGLLAALPPDDLQRWWPHLECVALTSGQVLHGPGETRAHAYFPTSAVIALAYILENGASAEVAVIGAEGYAGTCLILGGGSAPTNDTVLIAGQAYRISAQRITDEFERSATVRQLLMRHTQALATQMAQTAVCNRHHTVDQQVCGWLLHCLDRLHGADVATTQDVLGSMLGVRRESVTQVAGRLRTDGLIRCARGHIEVLDRGAMERRACECHAVVKKEYDRLLRPDLRADRVTVLTAH